ncbi:MULTISPECIES: hypothetical protein [Caballeronia]|uniref:hypothetical protein n=1 Tax=Caballeronia TaxID=1827195 RepID=UPI001364121B|nr:MULTISPECIES: hypothetical protein [Caballeronia]
MGTETIQLSELQLTDLTVADDGRKLRDSKNCAGKVRIGLDGKISVSFRYRFRFEGAEN